MAAAASHSSFQWQTCPVGREDSAGVTYLVLVSGAKLRASAGGRMLQCE